MSTRRAEWLPRAEDRNGRGDLLRRSFEERLDGRDDGATVAALFERLRLAELERAHALAAIDELPADVRGTIAGVLALPAEAQTALARLL